MCIFFVWGYFDPVNTVYENTNKRHRGDLIDVSAKTNTVDLNHVAVITECMLRRLIPVIAVRKLWYRRCHLFFQLDWFPQRHGRTTKIVSLRVVCECSPS